MTSPLLSIDSLSLGIEDGASERALFEPVDLELAPGEAALVRGRLGSGKTLLGLCCVGRLPRRVKVISGDIALREHADARVPVLPSVAAFVPAVAREAFVKATKIGVQIADAVRVAEGVSGAAARGRAKEWLGRAGFYDADATYDRFAFDLSFGEARAAAFALMLAYRPSLFIADSPRWGLSAGRFLGLLRLALGERTDRSMACLWLSAVPLPEVGAGKELWLEATRAPEIADESGQRAVFELARPRPSDPGSAAPASRRAALQATHMSAAAPARSGWFGKKAPLLFEDVSLRVETGEVLGILGDNGSGKSALAESLCGWRTLGHGRILTRRGRTAERTSGLGFVHQNPRAVLDPEATVSEVLGPGNGLALLSALGAPESLGARPTSILSTGELALVSLSRTLAERDRVLVLDDPTGPLDEASKRHFADVLRDLTRRGAACVLVSYDVGELRRTCDRLLVLLSGRVAEVGPSASVCERPRHPLTRALLDAAKSEAPYDGATPRGVVGCPFVPYCPRRLENRCEREFPPLAGDSRHGFACHNPLD